MFADLVSVDSSGMLASPRLVTVTRAYFARLTWLEEAPTGGMGLPKTTEVWYDLVRHLRSDIVLFSLRFAELAAFLFFSLVFGLDIGHYDGFPEKH